MHVSISAYDDGGLLRRAIATVRATLPDAHIAVVDGKYETWPEGAANSTDETPAIAQRHADSYHAGGPYPRESDKHAHRVALAPDDDWLLCLDADERLLTHPDPATLDARVHFPRIFNALVYGPRAVYWPRLFKPAWVEAIHRWDKYLFDVPGVDDADQAHRSDPVTIVHRHDCRDRAYRAAKLERFANEDRVSRYASADGEGEDQLDAYLTDDWPAVDYHRCPECGHDTLTRSQVTAYGTDELSRVTACVRADGCHAGREAFEIDRHLFLPDDWERGIEQNPRRLRAELVDAGCRLIGTVPADSLDALRPSIGLWVADHLEGGA